MDSQYILAILAGGKFERERNRPTKRAVNGRFSHVNGLLYFSDCVVMIALAVEGIPPDSCAIHAIQFTSDMMWCVVSRYVIHPNSIY